MNFQYSRYKLSGVEKIKERILEIVPGGLSWAIIIGMTVLSIKEPIVSSVIIIAFLLYWLMRIVYMNIFLVLSYIRLRIEKDTNWLERMKDLDNLDKYPDKFYMNKKNTKLENGAPRRTSSNSSHPQLWSGIPTTANAVIFYCRDKISAFIHHRYLLKLKKANNVLPNYRDIYHLVIIPVIKEAEEVVEPGIRVIAESGYPLEKVLLIIAVEEAAPDEVKNGAVRIQEKYKKGFLDLIVAIHPQGIVDEAKVKGSNTTYAAKKAAEYFKNKNIPYENILVSCFDADTVPANNYFSCLTYHFMITPERTKASFQPIPVYHNNIWDAPAFARVIDIGTSFFQLVESTNPKNLVTFSSHSMSFKALVDVGFWPIDMISDDSAIFWKAFIHYDGDYRVVPIYTTVSMDIVTADTMRKTFMNIYKQKRRWAWGVENFPIVMRAFLRYSKISFSNKISYGYKLLDSFVSWATWSFLLAFISWLPAVFAGRDFATTTAYYIVPRIQQTIFSLSSIGILICMIISLLLLPKRKTKMTILRYIIHSFEWLLIPVIILALSALPALDAQTRLLFGKYMEFWVTDKYRKKK